MRILITGGTGLIGSALCPALLDLGHDLTVLSRHPDSVDRKCGAAVKAIASLEQWQADMAFDAVINLAGESIIDASWTNARKQKLWASRVTLTEQLVQRIASATVKPSVLISGSAIGYYGDTGERPIDETASNASDFGAQLCAAWENAAQQASELNVRVCILRTGLVLSKHGGLLSRMRLPFQLGLGGRLGSGQQYMSWIHIDDYVAIVLRLLADGNATGPFNLTAPNPVTNQLFTEGLARALHRPAVIHSPVWLLSILLGERASLLTSGQRVVPRKIMNFGYTFSYPQLENAWGKLIH